MEPTEEDLASPEFAAVWGVIRSWDISRDLPVDRMRLYSGATGTDVMTILSALREAQVGTHHEYTIRRADGELIGGEYGFMGCDGPDDWLVAEEEAEFDDGPIEYTIERWLRVGQWWRTFGEPSTDEEEEE